MVIEIVDFPIKNGWIFHKLCDSLPEGNGRNITLRLRRHRFRRLRGFQSIAFFGPLAIAGPWISEIPWDGYHMAI